MKKKKKTKVEEGKKLDRFTVNSPEWCIKAGYEGVGGLSDDFSRD